MELRRAGEPRRAADRLRRLDRIGDWDDLIHEFGAEYVRDYQKFLVIKVLDRDFTADESKQVHTPTLPVERVWRAHLLRPRHYAKCCRVLAGPFDTLVDHAPYTATACGLDERWMRTKRRLREAFGPPSKRVKADDDDKPTSSAQIEIFVRTINGDTVTMNVTPSDSVGSVKLHLLLTGHAPDPRSVLLFAGRQLREGTTLAANGITQNQTTIRAIPRMNGC